MFIKQYLNKLDYNVCVVSSRKNMEIVGLHSFPTFMYGNQIDESEKIIGFNHYIKGLEISDNVYNSMIWFVANSVMSDFANPAFVIKEVLLGKEEGSLTNSDVEVNFNEAAETSVSNITVVFE